MNSYLNVFNSFKNKSSYHEDELTRTFLCLLKNIPIIQSMFIDMIREEMYNKNCDNIVPPITKVGSEIVNVSTQISDSNSLFNNISGRRVVSIIISDDKLYEETEIENSNRKARYDGVIIYDPSWVLIVENKPSVKNIWLEQLNPNINNNLEDIEIEKEPIALSWREVIESLGDLINKGLLVGLEKVIVEDFLEYIDNQFPQLNPYTNFSICKDNKYLLNKRCISIMEKINLGEVKYHKGWKDYIQVNNSCVKQIALSPEFNDDGWELMLHIYPGDSMIQGRNLYKTIDKDKVIALQSKACTVEPNMHYSFRASNLLGCNVTLDIKSYIDYWIDNCNRLSQVQREDFDDYFNKMQDEGIISELDMEQIKDKIINKNYQRINICPGIAIKHKWSKEQCLNLDKGDNFSKIIKDKIEEIINALGETLIEN